jgi:hypothetical protein
MRLLLMLALASAVGCSEPGRERLKETTKATYDEGTGRLMVLTHDANKNGRIDTWTEINGRRPRRSRIDRNEDGKLDRWEYYDDSGRLLKVGFSRPDDGTPDAWAFSGPDGRIERIEVSSTRDEKRIDRWETYEKGTLKTVTFDENGDGSPDRRLTYEAGVLALIETGPDGAGQYSRQVRVR